MSKRKPIVVMSWAMRQNIKVDAQNFTTKLIQLLNTDTGVEKIIFPSMGTITYVADLVNGTSIGLGAQNISTHENGEYSGEYSIDSLIDCGGQYVELGHWERKDYYGENYTSINKKLKLCIQKSVTPILCIGEKEKNISEQELYEHLTLELFNVLFGIQITHIPDIVIAYTPKWAVGRTIAASAPHIHKVGKMIREIISNMYDEYASDKIRIIYGGSVSPENAKLITENKMIDGVLVGRFGSIPERYAEVVNVVEKNKYKIL